MIVLAAWTCAALCAGTVLFKVALTFGAPWGHLTQGGFDSGVLPVRKRVLASGSAGLVTLMALAILSQAGQGPAWPRWMGYGATVLSDLTLAANAVSPPRPERLLRMPVATLALACAMPVMVIGPSRAHWG